VRRTGQGFYGGGFLAAKSILPRLMFGPADKLVVLRSALGFLVAFLLSWLPEPVKDEECLRSFNSPRVHVVSGLVEMAAGLGWLIHGYFTFFSGFTGTVSAAMTNLRAGATVSESDMMAVGAAGYLSFLFQPTSILCYMIIVEGLVRALAAFLTERTPGTLALAVPRALFVLVMDRKKAAFRRSALGPPRPDELRPIGSAGSGFLEVVSAGEKPWHDRQALEYAGEFYILDNRQWIRQGEHWALCYRFRPMLKGEIIRGSLVRF
jgi:hypothetical protein